MKHLLVYLVAALALAGCAGAATAVNPTAATSPSPHLPIAAGSNEGAAEPPSGSQLSEQERQALSRRAVDMLAQGTLVHSEYNEMTAYQREIFRVEIVQSTNERIISAIEQEFTDAGEPRTRVVRVSEEMEVYLEADPQDFRIEPIHRNERQDVGAVEPARWSWYVTPLRAGSARELRIESVAFIRTVDDVEKQQRPSETIRLKVHVNPVQSVLTLAGSYWWVILLLPLLWLAARGRWHRALPTPAGVDIRATTLQPHTLVSTPLVEQVAQPEASAEQPLLLTLRFSPTRGGARVVWEREQSSVETSFSLPYRRELLPTVIKALDAAQDPEHPAEGPQFSPAEQEQLAEVGLWTDGRVPAAAHRLVGRRLHEALIRQREATTMLAVAREAARREGRVLCYILRFPPDAVELAALPWEALWDERQALLLARSGRELDWCQRYLDLDQAPVPLLPDDQQLHILALSPLAQLPAELRTDERAARIATWQALADKGLLTWDELTPATMTGLDARLRHGPPPDIIHFYGHGTYRDGQGYLLFDGAEPGEVEWVDANRLAALLGGVRLIVLQACQSAMVGGQERGGLLTGVAPALSVVSEAVVAMQISLRVEAAACFAGVLYEELARGRSLQAAVAAARRSLYVTESDGASWYVPTLYIRAREALPIYFKGMK